MAQCFYDGEALHTRANVHDREINILQGEAKNIEGIFFASRRSVAGSPSTGYHQNIPFHKHKQDPPREGVVLVIAEVVAVIAATGCGRAITPDYGVSRSTPR